VLANNPKSIADYKKGKLNALNHLKGQVMRETKGKADIGVVTKIMLDKLT
jgi:aspartyl-tRNA(Asn)/glutamyl-tRNA(Gln) amidotransferase subunit B